MPHHHYSPVGGGGERERPRGQAALKIDDEATEGDGHHNQEQNDAKESENDYYGAWANPEIDDEMIESDAVPASLTDGVSPHSGIEDLMRIPSPIPGFDSRVRRACLLGSCCAA